MPDVISTKASLWIPADPVKSSRLLVSFGGWNGLAGIPIKRKGQTVIDDPESNCWEYEERAGRLHITPSLLTEQREGRPQFHTAFAWDVAFERCPAHEIHYEHFMQLNPDCRPCLAS